MTPLPHRLPPPTCASLLLFPGARAALDVVVSGGVRA
jgi:hypothetical protein